ncbi:hypothetical protein K0M31_014956 [Melipona bicolor]|uniref:Uncharacterized protein n=1 Tax=Melipona bicolor TaxID=60889 RepID=A0AA40FGL7_9HYME|nr:hypothetical protein K0M31_014956 [Melipona bicolor]
MENDPTQDKAQVGLADEAEWKKRGEKHHRQWRRSDARVPLPPTRPLVLVCSGGNLNPWRTAKGLLIAAMPADVSREIS